MDYARELAFLRQLLQRMHISSCTVDAPEDRIPPQIDLQLRAELYGLDNYTGFLENSMAQAKDNTVYRFFDEYGCNYMFLRLPDGGYFFIGPYLLSPPSREQLQQRAKALALSQEQLHRLELYYAALPLVEDESLLTCMVNTLAVHLWGSPEHYALEFVEYAIPDRYSPVVFTGAPAPVGDSPLSLSTLEQHYANERALMEAVSKGKLHLLTKAASTAFQSGAQARLADSLRDRKNYLFVLKTLLRKAAEQGGVHPMHIHRLSEHYAVLIESIRSIKQSNTLQEQMIRAFCQLVKQHSLSRYSFYVGQAITLVQYDLTADLRLHTIAQKLNVNSSYLSGLFHKEYGCTLTDFINRQRIDHGILLLQRTTKPVQEIAAECGISDANYFIRLFKKQTGFTPTGYRRQFGRA